MSKDLKDFYDNVYKTDISKFFFGYCSEALLISGCHKEAKRWLNENAPHAKSILDFGCGEGDFLNFLEGFTIRVGLDYSKQAIQKAKQKFPHIDFICDDESRLNQWEEEFDVVGCFGTVEHVDDPQRVIQLLVKTLKKDGYLIVSCPSFYNIRGIIWMTLQILFKVPMSLSDRHFFSMDNVIHLGKSANVELVHYNGQDMDVGQGKDFRADMQKRLTNALRDVNLDNSRVDELIRWVEKSIPYFPRSEYAGVEVVYIFKK